MERNLANFCERSHEPGMCDWMREANNAPGNNLSEQTVCIPPDATGGISNSFAVPATFFSLQSKFLYNNPRPIALDVNRSKTRVDLLNNEEVIYYSPIHIYSSDDWSSSDEFIIE